MPGTALHPHFALLSQYMTIAAPYLAAGAFALCALLLFLQLSLRRRFARLSLGRTGSIEESVTVLARDAKEMKEFKAELEKYLKHAENRLRGSVQGIGVVRFNPFANGQGGNQSFSCAFIDESGSGVVFSTLYARDRVGVYAKPVLNGASSFELSDEEKEAIERAKKSVAEHKK